MNLNVNNCKLILFALLLALFLGISLRLDAQIEDEKLTVQLWIDYNAKYHFSRKFKIYGDVGYRKISPNVWTRYYICPVVSYFHSLPLKSGKHLIITYHLGFDTFFLNSTDTFNVVEIRPFQGADVQWPTFKRLQINHYVRLEEQFEYVNSDRDFGLRLKYMFSGIFHWKNDN